MTMLVVGAHSGVHELDTGEERRLRRPVTALARRDEELWALTDRKLLWRSVRREPWERVASLPKSNGTCLGTTGSGVFVGTAEAHLFRLEGDDLLLLAGFDEAAGRDAWYTPWGGPPDTRSITADDDCVYVNVHVGGVLRSSDAGVTWEPTKLDIDADVHQVLAAHDMLLCAGANGLCVSTDKGETWTIQDDGLHASYCRAVAVCEGRVLLTACEGPHGGKSAIYARPLGGGPFEKSTPDWFADNIDTGRLTASGPLAAFAAPDGTVYLSADCGTSWQPVVSKLAAVTSLEFA